MLNKNNYTNFSNKLIKDTIILISTDAFLLILYLININEINFFYNINFCVSKDSTLIY